MLLKGVVFPDSGRNADPKAFYKQVRSQLIAGTERELKAPRILLDDLTFSTL